MSTLLVGGELGGVGALMLACLFAGAWIRSLRIQDTLATPWYEWKSGNGAIFRSEVFSKVPWLSVSPREFSYHSQPWNSDYPITEDRPGHDSDWRFLGFGAGEIQNITTVGPGVFTESFKTKYIRFPYWSLVSPLTLLSSWLLLGTLRGKSSYDGRIAITRSERQSD